VGGKIGAFGFCAQIAEETLIDDFVVIGFVYAIDFEGIRLVDEIEERWKGVA
jgi:hypothetical protein